MSGNLAKVALAISSFRSDAAVIALLAGVFAEGKPRFGAVIVVDSLASGAIAKEIERQGWPVDYINADHNLGSAGNLALRLRTAASADTDWCYAVNHDGRIDPGQIMALVAHGESRRRIGAVYPSLLYSARGAIEGPKRTLAPRAIFGFEWEKVGDPCQNVAWSSSNCALYSLAAIREGVEVWGDLWMGWEDLALGWMFGKRGWGQIQCGDVIIADSYEYESITAMGRSAHVTVKPIWYSYYQVRNMILINRRTRGEACGWYHIARRIIISMGVALLVGGRRREWLKLFSSGFVAGLKGVTGKGPVP